MDLRPEDIQSKKRIGHLNGKPVIEVITTGGFHMLLVSKGQGMETLGTGPHKVVARHIAKKRNQDLVLTELAKSDYIAPEFYQHLLPHYEALTDRCNALSRK